MDTFASTMMAGPDNAMQQEAAFLEALNDKAIGVTLRADCYEREVHNGSYPACVSLTEVS